MTAAILNIIIIAVGLFSLWRGWRCGAARELVLLIGWGFGLIFALIGGEPFAEWLSREGGMGTSPEALIFTRWLAISLIYGLVLAISLLGLLPLSKLIGVIPVGAFSSVTGALFSGLRWLTGLSMLLNLWGAYDGDCLAVRVADGGDGGVVEEVMLIAPTLTGAPDFSEMYHLKQLREAKSISLLGTAGAECRQQTLEPKCVLIK